MNKDIRLRFFIPIFVLSGLLFSVGCNAPKDQLTAFNRHFEASDYEAAIVFAEERISRHTKYEMSAEFAEKKNAKLKNPARDDLLWVLQVATVKRISKDYQKSTDCFDKSENMLKYYNEQSTVGDIFGSTLVNENVIPYRGEEYDGIMVNTYKALNFMAEGDMDLARVEFNRALDRQRRAREVFAEEISKLKAELDEKQSTAKYDVKANVENPQTQELLAQKYPGLYEFEAYPDFVNPFTTYMAGVYFNLVGDHSKAVDLLKESYGMVQDNPYIAEDLSVTENILDGQGRLENTVWVIFENGLGPVKTEFRLDIPLFIVTRSVRYVGIALPRLEYRNRAYQHLTIETGDGKSYTTSIVAEMDRVVQTEFSKDFEGILTRAIISAAAKATAQYLLQQQGDSAGSIMSIAAAGYSFVTNAADVRIWTSLPKEFQVARFPKPADGKLRISPPIAAPLIIDVPACNNALVYVRIIAAGAEPIYEVMTF